MTKKETERREQLKLDLISMMGFNESRYDNIFYSDEKARRLKFNKNKVRYEIKAAGRWVRLHSYYYKDIEIVNGKIKKQGGVKWV